MSHKDAISNADNVRAMTDEQLAELLCAADWCESCDQTRENGTCGAMELGGPLNKHCVAAGLRWLKLPAEMNASCALHSSEDCVEPCVEGPCPDEALEEQT